MLSLMLECDRYYTLPRIQQGQLTIETSVALSLNNFKLQVLNLK
ncbi:hypothetical protein [Nostoc sp. UHCC 0252]|nr:hypothetical protein [Nostoc sp. UHCC 0252]MEA5600758.1 hypothetical protein [Nostoc sp. UHCC 0252]